MKETPGAVYNPNSDWMEEISMLQHLTADNSRDTGNQANKDKRSYLAELAPPLIIKPASYPQVQLRLACLAACWGERG